MKQTQFSGYDPSWEKLVKENHRLQALGIIDEYGRPTGKTLPAENKRKQINQNPYQRGTIEYESWKNNFKNWKEARNFYLGASESGQKARANYWNKDIKNFFGLMPDGGWQEKPFSDFSTKAQKVIIYNRKVMLEYAVKHKLFTRKDWRKAYIKNRKVFRIYKESKDFRNTRINKSFYKVLKGIGGYGFRMRFMVEKNGKTSQNIDLQSPRFNNLAYLPAKGNNVNTNDLSFSHSVKKVENTAKTQFAGISVAFEFIITLILLTLFWKCIRSCRAFRLVKNLTN